MSNKQKRTSEDDRLDAFQDLLKKKFAAKKQTTKTVNSSDSDEEPAKPTATVATNANAAPKPTDNRESRRRSEVNKNRMRHRGSDDSTESSDSDDDNKRGRGGHSNWQYSGTDYSYSSGYGMVPMQSMAFTSPYVDSFDKPKKSFESSDGSSSDECFEGYDNVEDGVEFYYKPKSTGRTEFTVTVEPKKQPWLPMMKCGFKPMVNCMAPPAYLIPPNCNNPPQPLHTNFQCIPPQYNDYQTYQNQCCMMPCCGGNNNYSSNAQPGNYNYDYANNLLAAAMHSQSSHSSHHSGRHRSQASSAKTGRTAVVSKIEDVSNKTQLNRHQSGDAGDSKLPVEKADSNVTSLATTLSS